MDGSLIYIQYVLVDDIDFAPLDGTSYVVGVSPSSFIQDIVNNIFDQNPSLRIYDEHNLDVLKIKQPVSPETIVPSANSSRLCSRLSVPSLQPILEQLRKQSKESNPTEPTNDYVQRLPRYTQAKVDFENVELVSAIVVRRTTADERAKRNRNKPPEAGLTIRCNNLHDIIHGNAPHGLVNGSANRYAFPVALFDKNLALLQHRLESLSVAFGLDKCQHLFPKELDFYRIANEFAAIEEHASEEKRMKALKSFFEAIFRKEPKLEKEVAMDGRSDTFRSIDENASNMKFNGTYLTKIGADANSISTTIIEVKSSVHEDVLGQLTKDYAKEVYGFKNKDYFDSTYFPKIFIALNGHKLQIAIAICLETVIVDEILSLDMRVHFSRNELTQKVARAALALKDCFIQLSEYYSKLTAGQQLSFFPSPTLVPFDTSKPLIKDAFEASPPNFRGLRIVGRLGLNNIAIGRSNQSNSPHMRRNLFLAKWLDHADNEPELVVKLAKQYGDAVHQCLAEQTLAPKLYLCQPVIGDLTVVVLEHAKGRPLNGFSESALDALDKPLLFRQLKNVVNILQKHRLVHGDLRAPNIIVDASDPQSVAMKVIDFDWAAKHGEGFYPSTINKDELYAEWHDGVGPMERMKMEHDEFAVFDVVGPKYLGITRWPCAPNAP